ncbi:tryptophan synthase subunit beta like protein [Pokkaliibacter sp. MBI-7]|uniref:tryptophan synthase subunit beta like protein n=1 Tax=Pokkaliibacter sp. MBI-7 TaxID=3040600 RepID=UPI00244689D1|nr:tryptophan synthase subunit beta like protein [Pokkaliibacter sp. MBI-7]MDH2434444.1 tryptophan synthase subunit beta like protein [Pokkaliibacter sp. MBI-7]
MPYVERNADGQIIAVYAVEQPQAHEFLEPDDQDLQQFLFQDNGRTFAYMRQSDLELQRVLEDVIDLLIDKGILMFTDLPVEAQKKLVGRKRVRQVLKHRNTILGTDDEDDPLPL